MSNRHLLFRLCIKDEDRDDTVDLFRDCDTQTYRLFVNLKLGCSDLTVEQLALLRDALASAVSQHTPWPTQDDRL